MPQKTWAVGEEVLAADFNAYVQDQVVPQFPTSAARDAEWAAPPNGALCVTTDSNTLWQRVAGAWYAGQGLLGHALSAYDTNFASGVAVIDITGLAVGPIQVPPGRTIKATLQIGQATMQTGPLAPMYVRIGVDGDEAAAHADRQILWVPSSAVGNVTGPHCTFAFTVAAGAHTFRAAAGFIAAGSTATFFGVNANHHLVIEDAGAA